MSKILMAWATGLVLGTALLAGPTPKGADQKTCLEEVSAPPFSGTPVDPREVAGRSHPPYFPWAKRSRRD